MAVRFIACGLKVWTLVAIATGLLLAQEDYGKNDEALGFHLRGEVLNFPAGESLQVRMRSLGHSDMGLSTDMSTDVSSTAYFELYSVRPGQYMLEVADLYGNAIYRQPVTVSGEGDYVRVTLPQRRLARPVTGTVSVRELRQTVAPKALKEHRKGLEAFRKQNFDQAVVHFTKAIVIDPNFAAAHNELGAVYYSMKEVDKAAAEFRRALKLSPDYGPAARNLALALLVCEQYSEAEAAARAALRSDPNSEDARFMLGVSLYREGRRHQEAVENLRWAGNQHPKGRLMAAEILARLGRRSEAAVELRRYLMSSDTSADRQKVESWLADLAEPSGPSDYTNSPSR